MEIHKDLVVGKLVEFQQELDKIRDKADKFIQYKDARCGYVYAWFNVERKYFV